MKTKTRNRRIEYVQTALKQDAKTYPNRPLNKFAELVFLIGEQFDDLNNLKPTTKGQPCIDEYKVTVKGTNGTTKHKKT